MSLEPGLGFRVNERYDWLGWWTKGCNKAEQCSRCEVNGYGGPPHLLGAEKASLRDRQQIES